MLLITESYFTSLDKAELQVSQYKYMEQCIMLALTVKHNTNTTYNNAHFLLIKLSGKATINDICNGAIWK